MTTRKLATALILLALGYAPLAHGCVTDEAWFVLDALLVAAFAIFLAGRAQQRRWPTTPVGPWIPAGMLFLLGLIQTLNPIYAYDPVNHGMTPLSSHRPDLPGTMDQRTSTIALIHWASLAMGFFTLLNLTRDRTTRWWLLGTMAAVGSALAVLGIILKIQGATVVPFTNSHSPTFFATYVYHAHAAAFLNLCWPAALALTIRSLAAERPLSRAIWINAFLMIYLALFINISKFGHLAALPGLGLALFTLRKGLPPAQSSLPILTRLVLGIILLSAAAILLLPLLGRSIGRWDHVLREGFGGRPVIYGIVTSMIRQYPLWGTGPGTFHLVLPYFAVPIQSTMPGRLTHAHQDYLQTAVECGIFGAAIWGILLAGGFAKGIVNLVRHPEELSSGSALVALTVLGIHALVDFPMQIGSLRLYAAVYFAMLWRVRSPIAHPESGHGIRGSLAPPAT
jgi:O-antigen ligase